MQKPGVCPADGGRRSGAPGRRRGTADANEMLMRTIAGLRRFYPYLALTAASLQIPGLITMHAARISGGDVSNIIPGGQSAGYPADGDING